MLGSYILDSFGRLHAKFEICWSAKVFGPNLSKLRQLKFNKTEFG